MFEIWQQKGRKLLKLEHKWYIIRSLYKKVITPFNIYTISLINGISTDCLQISVLLSHPVFLRDSAYVNKDWLARIIMVKEKWLLNLRWKWHLESIFFLQMLKQFWLGPWVFPEDLFWRLLYVVERSNTGCQSRADCSNIK